MEERAFEVGDAVRRNDGVIGWLYSVDSAGPWGYMICPKLEDPTFAFTLGVSFSELEHIEIKIIKAESGNRLPLTEGVQTWQDGKLIIQNSVNVPGMRMRNLFVFETFPNHTACRDFLNSYEHKYVGMLIVNWQIVPVLDHVGVMIELKEMWDRK